MSRRGWSFQRTFLRASKKKPPKRFCLRKSICQVFRREFVTNPLTGNAFSTEARYLAIFSVPVENSREQGGIAVHKPERTVMAPEASMRRTAGMVSVTSVMIALLTCLDEHKRCWSALGLVLVGCRDLALTRLDVNNLH